jgi:hypothetical protein
VLEKYHWMLYFLVPAMYPRFLITLDEDLEPKPVTVRVGTVSSTYEGVILYFDPVFRLSMSWDKRASHAQSLVSKPIRHPYDWQPRNVRSSQRKNTSHLRACWKGSSCYRRTLAGRRKWSCSLHRHGASDVFSSFSNLHSPCNYGRWGVVA